MRLIDADKLCMHLADLQLSNTPDERDSAEVQKEMKSNYEFIELLIKVSENQPTAYDVDKVVDILTSKGIDRIRKSTSPFDNFAGMAVAYKDAVAVVKDGWNDCIDAIGSGEDK